jgi:hypothetical protein
MPYAPKSTLAPPSDTENFRSTPHLACTREIARVQVQRDRLADLLRALIEEKRETLARSTDGRLTTTDQIERLDDRVARILRGES